LKFDIQFEILPELCKFLRFGSLSTITLVVKKKKTQSWACYVSRAPTSIPYVSVGLRGLEFLPRLHLYQLIAQTAQGPAQRKNRVQMQHMTEHTRDHKPAGTTISFSSSKPTTTTSASVQGSSLSTNLLHWPPCKRRITHSPHSQKRVKKKLRMHQIDNFLLVM